MSIKIENPEPNDTVERFQRVSSLGGGVHAPGAAVTRPRPETWADVADWVIMVVGVLSVLGLVSGVLTGGGGGV